MLYSGLTLRHADAKYAVMHIALFANPLICDLSSFIYWLTCNVIICYWEIFCNYISSRKLSLICVRWNCIKLFLWVFYILASTYLVDGLCCFSVRFEAYLCVFALAFWLSCFDAHYTVILLCGYVMFLMYWQLNWSGAEVGFYGKICRCLELNESCWHSVLSRVVVRVSNSLTRQW